ncbi:MAG: hypothetical protein R3E68_16945 [Burkholderiaceae bacterium]
MFVLGGLVGAAAYMLTYDWVKGTGVLADILGGKSTLGAVANTAYPSIIAAVPGEALGIAVGLVLVLVAFLLPDRLRASKGPQADTGVARASSR